MSMGYRHAVLCIGCHWCVSVSCHFPPFIFIMPSLLLFVVPSPCHLLHVVSPPPFLLTISPLLLLVSCLLLPLLLLSSLLFLISPLFHVISPSLSSSPFSASSLSLLPSSPHAFTFLLLLVVSLPLSSSPCSSPHCITIVPPPTSPC